jgi:hypothetical protein
MSDTSPAHPEDIFIDRYMPGATSEQREEARQNVRNLVAVLVRINARLRETERRKSDSPESTEGGRVGIPALEPNI